MRSETSSAFSLTRRRAHSLFRFRRGRCSRLSRAAASTGFRASFMAPPLSGPADMRPSPVITVIRFRGERTSGYRGWTAIVLARGKPLKVGSRNSSLSRLARALAIAAGALLAASASLAQIKPATPTPPIRARSAPAQQKQRTPSPPRGQPARQPRATRPPTVGIADAEREARSANSAAAWRRCAFAAASAACGRYKPAAAHSSPRAAREDAGLRRGMGQDETRVERRVADVARFRDAMPDALGASNG